MSLLVLVRVYCRIKFLGSRCLVIVSDKSDFSCGRPKVAGRLCVWLGTLLMSGISSFFWLKTFGILFNAFSDFALNESGFVSSSSGSALEPTIPVIRRNISRATPLLALLPFVVAIETAPPRRPVGADTRFMSHKYDKLWLIKILSHRPWFIVERYQSEIMSNH